MGERLYHVEEAAKRLTLTKSTLDKMRVRGGGPRFIKLGRSVRYMEADIQGWIATGRKASTSDGANDNEGRG